ncbi:hypothetical protein K710_0344 [Streptococcus iniae SF1]|nr:hypothetical protein K710_0344 [Streptococcus iniae SF1]
MIPKKGRLNSYQVPYKYKEDYFAILFVIIVLVLFR